MELVTELDSFDGCFVGTTGSGAAYGPIQRECKGLVTAACTLLLAGVIRVFVICFAFVSGNKFVLLLNFFDLIAGAAMLCVPYGQAVTGFCNSLTKKVEEICSKAGCVPTFPWDSFDLPMRRSNTDKFCYRNLTALKMSIAYQDTEGFFRALKTAEKPGMLGTFVRTSEPGVLTVLRYAGDGGPPIMTPNFTFIDIVLNDQRFQRSSISRLIQKICFGPSQKGFVTDCYNTWPGLDQFETGDAMIGQFTGLVYIPADGPYDVDFYSQGPRSNYYRLRFSAFQFTSDGDRGGANSFSGLELRKGWIPFELTSVCVTEQCPRFGYRGFFSVRPTGAPYPEYPDFILPGDPAVFGAYPAGMRSKVMSDAEVFALASNLYVEP